MRPIPEHEIRTAAQAVEAGNLVVIPTQRWYMICADATNTTACHRIFDAKHRPRSKSLVLITPSTSHCREMFTVNDDAQRLMDAFWPGDLALRLPWRDEQTAHQHEPVGTPALVTHAPGPLGHLAQSANVPIAATTVNISGDASLDAPGPAITTTEVNDFLNLTGIAVSVILDGGICPAANHLTIVDCSATDARLDRPGLVHERAIAAALAR
jgi:L-threonylcarbamoyladenylate synthase